VSAARHLRGGARAARLGRIAGTIRPEQTSESVAAGLHDEMAERTAPSGVSPGSAQAAGKHAPEDATALLLIEDDEGDALLVADQLERSLPSGRLLFARTLAEALPILNSGIDCVLLDLQLPDASGLRAVEEVRSRSPSIPLIVLTGLDDEAAGVAAVSAGAQDYLVKGKVDGGVLARAIRYAIGRRRADETERALLLAQAQAREAARLERGLTPTPMIAGSGMWVASSYRPGRRRALLGGDFYDAVATPDGKLRLLVGDVCGHGADEAAIGACLRSAWRALALACEQLSDTIPILQEILDHEKHLPNLFATLCTLEVVPASSSASVIQVGHPAPIVISSDRVTGFDDAVGGAAIGVGAASWSARSFDLPREWALLLYTDGIIEGRVGSGAERLGEQGLHRLVEEAIRRRPDWRDNPQALLDELVSSAERLNGGPLVDDVAMLLIGPHRLSTTGT
jgi:serine phosphatase RsbU (regulator of sigma subunit)